MRHNIFCLIEHFLISFSQLRVILPSAWFSATRLSLFRFSTPETKYRPFLFVPIVRLTDVLGRTRMPVTFSEKQLVEKSAVRVSGNEVHIVYSDCGLDVRHFSRICLPVTSPY